ncbi:hypothetical protein WME79_11670 [Sorangium sp. So ce726]|uniref:hypothetical protein n=1 Tax=Sorangium sp. So ce726 TaxID=3133319 RepID=UPI003F5E4AC5
MIKQFQQRNAAAPYPTTGVDTGGPVVGPTAAAEVELKFKANASVDLGELGFATEADSGPAFLVLVPEAVAVASATTAADRVVILSPGKVAYAVVEQPEFRQYVGRDAMNGVQKALEQALVCAIGKLSESVCGQAPSPAPKPPPPPTKDDELQTECSTLKAKLDSFKNVVSTELQDLKVAANTMGPSAWNNVQSALKRLQNALEEVKK